MTPTSRLTGKRARFVEEYLVDLNGTRAAIAAGYSRRSARAIACELLTKPDVRAVVDAERAARAARSDDLIWAVLRQLERIALADVRELFGPDGRLRPVAALSDTIAAAVEAVELPESAAAQLPLPLLTDGLPLAPVVPVKIKLESKLKAIELLGRHLGLWDSEAGEATGRTLEGLLRGLIQTEPA